MVLIEAGDRHGVKIQINSTQIPLELKLFS